MQCVSWTPTLPSAGMLCVLFFVFLCVFVFGSVEEYMRTSTHPVPHPHTQYNHTHNTTNTTPHNTTQHHIPPPHPHPTRSLPSVESLQIPTIPDAFVHTRNTNADLASLTAPAADVLLTAQHNGTITGANGREYQVAGSLYMGQGYWAMGEDMPMGHLSDFQVGGGMVVVVVCVVWCFVVCCVLYTMC